MTCEFCLIAQGKADADIVHQDGQALAVLHLKPATPGHLLVFSKEHHPILEQVPEWILTHLAEIANQLGAALFDALDIKGTNILIQNGVAAGQAVPHFSIEIIPRTEDDGINLTWQPDTISGPELDQTANQLKEAINNSTTPKKKEGPTKEAEKPASKTPPEENYLIKQLRRIP